MKTKINLNNMKKMMMNHKITLNDRQSNGKMGKWEKLFYTTSPPWKFWRRPTWQAQEESTHYLPCGRLPSDRSWTETLDNFPGGPHSCRLGLPGNFQRGNPHGNTHNNSRRTGPPDIFSLPTENFWQLLMGWRQVRESNKVATETNS